MAKVGLTKREQQGWFTARLEVAGYLLSKEDCMHLRPACQRLREQAQKMGPLQPGQAEALKKIGQFVKDHTL